MSIRQTRLEYTTERMARIRAPKVSVAEFMARVKRLMARRMVADGVIESNEKQPADWYYEANGQFGTIRAFTRGEARAAVKRELGVKQLPADLFLTKDVPHEDSTGSARAA
jgi:hypothetical protein